MKISARTFLMKIGGVCGILSVLIALTSIILALSYSPWFEWTSDWLSHLGGPLAIDSPAQSIFNTGLMIAGIFGVVFGIALRNSGIFKTKQGNLGAMLVTVDMLFLMAIGAFPEDTGYPHTFATLAFFVLIPVILFLLGWDLLKTSKRRLGWFTIALFIVSLVSLVLFFIPRPFGSNAIAEITSVIALVIFVIVFGIHMYKRASQSPEKKYKKEEKKKGKKKSTRKGD